MNKAILVIDMPNSCNECKIRFDDEYSIWCPYDNPEPNGIWKYVDSGTKPDWCPLKPIPEKYDVLAAIENNPNYDPSYDIGRNDCIDEILGT